MEFGVAGGVEGGDGFESEARAAEAASDFAEGEDVKVHAGDEAEVGEDPVAEFVALEGHEEAGAEQPGAAFGMEEVEPAVVDVKDEESAGLEDATELAEGFGAMGASADEAEGGEHADGGVEGGGIEDGEVAKVVLDEVCAEALVFELLTGDGEHVWGEVEAGDVEAAAGKLDDVAAGAAAEVEELCGSGEEGVEEFGVEIEEAGALVVTVVVAGHAGGMDVLPGGGRDMVFGVVERIHREGDFSGGRGKVKGKRTQSTQRVVLRSAE